MIEIILREEISVVSTSLENIGYDLLIGTLLQTSTLTSVEVIPRQLNRSLPDCLSILHMVARGRQRFDGCLGRFLRLI